MIQIHTLPKITKAKKKRLGQGHGSGKGKTAGRGTKGQGARGKIPVALSGVNMLLVHRLPLLRGKYRNKPTKDKPLVINVKYLNLLPAKSVVDIATLAKYRIVKEEDARQFGVKILGDGEITVPLIVKLACSKNAASKIEAAGGSVEYNKTK